MGPHQAVFSNHSWLLAQGLFLVVLGDHMQYQCQTFIYLKAWTLVGYLQLRRGGGYRRGVMRFFFLIFHPLKQPSFACTGVLVTGVQIDSLGKPYQLWASSCYTCYCCPLFWLLLWTQLKVHFSLFHNNSCYYFHLLSCMAISRCQWECESYTNLINCRTQVKHSIHHFPLDQSYLHIRLNYWLSGLVIG